MIRDITERQFKRQAEPSVIPCPFRQLNDRTEGFYYLVNFKADSEFPKELERQYKITEGILRTIVIRKDEE